jgi:hypothetical protein
VSGPIKKPTAAKKVAAALDRQRVREFVAVRTEFARRLAAPGARAFKAKPGLGGRRHRVRRAKAVRS